MSTIASLHDRFMKASVDVELNRLSPGLNVGLDIVVDDQSFRLNFENGALVEGTKDWPVITISAAFSEWDKVLSSPPPSTYHSFTALQIANPVFDVSGEPQLLASARPFLERIFESVTASRPAGAESVARSLELISGRYAKVNVGHELYEIYYEVAGEGTPVLFLHTAGADGRQYLDQMSDIALAQNFKMYAVDLPFHGKSMPPRDWDGAPYLLTAGRYRDWCAAFIEQVIGEKVIVVGGSMGAAMALVLAAECSDKLLGAVALEPPFQSRGRRNPFQNHVSVHGGLHNGAYVRGLMSPTSPISDRRRASWIYSQGGPGVYPGDLAFYSDEFDGAVTAPQIDSSKTPVALLSGAYDYSATPADGAKLASLISGSLHIVMPGLGHFPMTEHPDAFRPYLIEGLDFVTSAKEKTI